MSQVLEMNEKQLQDAILELAAILNWTGYHTFDSRKSHEGFPDLVLVRWGRLLFVELKCKTKLSQMQILWREVLAPVVARNTTVQYCMWTPEHLRNGTIEQTLKVA